MPIYEYKCNDCKKVIEIHQNINDPEKTICPYCNGKIKRIMSYTSFVLKGNGWANDGYSKKVN